MTDILRINAIVLRLSQFTFMDENGRRKSLTPLDYKWMHDNYFYWGKTTDDFLSDYTDN